MAQPIKLLGTNYQLLELEGEEGLATVYRAFDTNLERNIAIKVFNRLPRSADVFLKRFNREANALAKLSHSNIIKTFDYGEHEGLPFLVMEYVPGGTLKKNLSGKPMLWQEALRITIPIARALEYAHRQGVIHRDIKPSNILITENNEPLLTDFGLGRIIEGDEEADRTGKGIGTAEYMAPEQLQGKVDKTVDIYSLGVTLYEMLTGRPPFKADTPTDLLLQKLNEPPPKPSLFAPDLPKPLEKVVLKAVEINPKDRFQNMGEFATTLEKLLETSKPIGEESFLRRFLKRLSGDSTTDAPPPDAR